MLSILLISSLLNVAIAAWVAGPFTNKDVQTDRFKAFAQQYPSLVTFEVIGKSVGGKDILLFKIGNPNGARVMWDAYIHGGEDYGSEMMYSLTYWLLTSNTAETNKILLENFLLFIPVVLPDTNAEVPRYNLNYVNLNRNFKTGWVRMSETVTDVVYQNASGPSPASEPELKP